MLFKELDKGKIFTYQGKAGKTKTAIKSGERHALTLPEGEEVKIHLTKKVSFPAPIRGGEFAIDTEGRGMIVEPLKNGFYSCEFIERIGRGILPENQVSIISPKNNDLGEDRNKLYITLQIVEKALKNARNALETGKDIVEDMA